MVSGEKVPPAPGGSRGEMGNLKQSWDQLVGVVVPANRVSVPIVSLETVTTT